MPKKIDDELKARAVRLVNDHQGESRGRRDPARGNNFLRRGTRPPQSLIMGFTDTMRAEGYAVESICRVLREQGCRIAARTYRSWKRTGRVVAARTVTDAHVVHAVREIAPAKDGTRAGDLLDRDFTAAAPNQTWVTDFTYVRTWAGFTYVAFIVDVYAQRIVAWHAATTKQTDLVMIPLRMALWQRDREGHPTEPAS